MIRGWVLIQNVTQPHERPPSGSRVSLRPGADEGVSALAYLFLSFHDHVLYSRSMCVAVYMCVQVCVCVCLYVCLSECCLHVTECFRRTEKICAPGAFPFRAGDNYLTV